MITLIIFTLDSALEIILSLCRIFDSDILQILSMKLEPHIRRHSAWNCNLVINTT